MTSSFAFISFLKSLNLFLTLGLLKNLLNLLEIMAMSSFSKSLSPSSLLTLKDFKAMLFFLSSSTLSFAKSYSYEINEPIRSLRDKLSRLFASFMVVLFVLYYFSNDLIIFFTFSLCEGVS